MLVPIKLRTLTGRPMAQSKQRDQNGKMKDLAPFREDSDQEHLTTDQGLRINDDQNSLKAGERGGSLLEDFILREKITHFDHERILAPTDGAVTGRELRKIRGDLGAHCATVA